MEFITQINLSSVGLYIGLCISLVIGYYTFKKLTYWQQRVAKAETEVDELKQEIRALVHADFSFGKRFCRLEKQISQMDLRQDDLEQDTKADTAYTKALKLIESGNTIDDITAITGLNRAEVQLLINLHGYKTNVKSHFQGK